MISTIIFVFTSESLTSSFASVHLGNGFCDTEYNTDICLFDGGACLNVPGLPKCEAPVPIYVGDDICHGGICNTTGCEYDGNDCKIDPNECNVEYEWLPDTNGECNGMEYNSEACDYDAGDCDEFNAMYPNCTTW